jgi:hypothetical protein
MTPAARRRVLGVAVPLAVAVAIVAGLAVSHHGTRKHSGESNATSTTGSSSSFPAGATDPPGSTVPAGVKVQPGSTVRSVPGSDVELPALPTGRVAEVPSSIATNCSVDVTKALQSWIDATPDNSTLRLARDACYRVDETLSLTNRKRLRIEGNGATLRAFTTGDRTRAQLRLRLSTDVLVQDLVVRGANPHAGATESAYVAKLEAQHAFDIQGVSNVFLLHVQAHDLYGDFVYVGVGAKKPSTNVTVYQSSFERSGRQGISVTGGVNVAIVDNTVGGAARSLFDLEANTTSASIRHILIVGNTTGPARNFWLANKGKDASIGDISIIRNRMTGTTRGLVFVYSSGASPRGPYLFQSNQLVAAGRLGDEGSKGAFFFGGAHDVTIDRNSVKFAPGIIAIELRNTHNVTVSGNQFLGQGTLLQPTQGSSNYHVS